jgi:DNA-binding SARP family transcriptional activator
LTSFRLLGSFEIVDDNGDQVGITRLKHRQLLAALLLRANTAVTFEQLVADLWGGDAPRSARGNVKTYVSQLRALVDGIGTNGGGYLVRAEPRDLDVTAFDALLQRGLKDLAAGDPDGAGTHLEEALVLWRGQALQDIPLHGDLAFAHAHLEEKRLTCVEELMGVRLLQGRHTEVLAQLRPLVAAHPLHERLWALQMTALYRDGRGAEALDAYRTLRGHLVDQLGVEPSSEVQALHQRILERCPSLDPRARSRAPLRESATATATPQQLPIDMGGFGHPDLSRETERLLTPRERPAPPVVVVTGSPGVGKSALAVHAAHRLTGEFPDGQLYVDLHGGVLGARPLDPYDALSGFLWALGVRDLPAECEEAASCLRTVLSGRRVLLVLDNACSAAQVRPLLPSAPECAVIVTSRHLLPGLPGGGRIRVPVLPCERAVGVLAHLTGGRPVDRRTADRLAHLVGCVPLGLAAVAALLAARPDWSPDDLAARLADEETRLALLDSDDFRVSRSLGSSHAALAETGHEESARALCLLSTGAGRVFDLAEAAGLLGVPEPEADRVLGPLLLTHLLDSPAQGRFRVPELVRLHARAQRSRVAPRAPGLTVGS